MRSRKIIGILLLFCLLLSFTAVSAGSIKDHHIGTGDPFKGDPVAYPLLKNYEDMFTIKKSSDSSILINGTEYTRTEIGVWIDPEGRAAEGEVLEKIEQQYQYERYIKNMFSFVVCCFLFIITTIWFVICVLDLIGRGKMLQKAGENGWLICVPFYGAYLEYKTYWKKEMYPVLFGAALASITVPFVCFVALAMNIKMRMEAYKCFGKDSLFAILDVFGLGFIGSLICGFSDAEFSAAEAHSDTDYDPVVQM